MAGGVELALVLVAPAVIGGVELLGLAAVAPVAIETVAVVAVSAAAIGSVCHEITSSLVEWCRFARCEGNMA